MKKIFSVHFVAKETWQLIIILLGFDVVMNSG